MLLSPQVAPVHAVIILWQSWHLQVLLVLRTEFHLQTKFVNFFFVFFFFCPKILRTKPQANWFFRSLRKQNLDFSSGLFSYKLVHISYVGYRQDINALIGSSRPQITLVFFAFEGSWHWLFKYGCKRKWGPSLSLTIRWKKKHTQVNNIPSCVQSSHSWTSAQRWWWINEKRHCSIFVTRTHAVMWSWTKFHAGVLFNVIMLPDLS